MNIIDFDGTRTDTPGFYRMTAAQYHADPCATPSLSSSIAKVLLKQTPRHAFAAHPRYTPPRPKKTKPAMALGSVVHELLLGKGGGIVVVEADDWRTKAAQEQRDKAEAAGKVPVLIEQFNEADKIAEYVREALPGMERAHDMFRNGEAEIVAIWREPNGAICRAMLDHAAIDREVNARIDDLKTSGVDIGPDAIGKVIANMGYEVSAAFYMRGVSALLPEVKNISFRFAFVETDEPYEVVAVELDRTGYEIGRRQVCAAIHVWRECQLSGKWPGFPRRLIQAEYPAWAATQWELRETDDKLLEGVSY